jgi:AraC-like DNA-binding protein
MHHAGMDDPADATLPVPPPRFLLTGMWRFYRPARFAGRARSTPQHLVHLVERGGYRLQLAGRVWDIEAPALIWYHGAEPVAWQGDSRSVSFASVAFACPGLAPPPAGARVIAAAPAQRRAWAGLLAAAPAADLVGQLRLQAAACHWLEQLLASFAVDAVDSLWDRVERHALVGGPIGVRALATWAGVGTSTLERACRQRHGTSPARRLRDLRLDQAAALLAQGAVPAATAAVACGWGGRRSLRRAMRRRRLT